MLHSSTKSMTIFTCSSLEKQNTALASGRDWYNEAEQEKESEEQKWNLMAEQNSLLHWKKMQEILQLNDSSVSQVL